MAQPSPEIKAKLAQLKAEAKIRAERDIQRQKAIRNAEQAAGKPVVLPTDKKAKGGLEEFLETSKVKQRLYRGQRRVPKPDKFITTQDRATPSFTHDPEVANVYSQQLGWNIAHGPGSTSVPVYVQMQKPFDVRDLGEHITLYDFVNQMDHDLSVPHHPKKLGYEDLADILNTLDHHASKGQAKQKIIAADKTGLSRIRNFSQLADEVMLAGKKRDTDRILYDLLADSSIDTYALADSHEVVKQLKKQGYDGMIHKDVFDAGMPYYKGDPSNIGEGFDAKHTIDAYRPFHQEKIKSAIGNRGTYDTTNPDITKAKGGSVMGINVASDRKAGRNYADLIVDGHKTLESRNGDSLRPYVGKRVAIVRTGAGPAKAIGEVTIGEPMVVNSKKFRELEHKHMVPKGSAFDINTPTKHLYPLHDPERYEAERNVGHGIVARKVMHKADGGSIPSQDVMRLAIGGSGPRNWLKGTVDKVTDPLKVKTDQFAQRIQERGGMLSSAERSRIQQTNPANLSLNQWIESNLANYIKKQMGGPNDPVRKLAEEGILHFDPNTVPIMGGDEDMAAHANRRREMLGGEKLAKSPLAQAWEDAVDVRMEPMEVSDILGVLKEHSEPWMEKADPKTKVHDLYAGDELGFDHIVDVLKEDLANGRIRPEQLNKVSMADAVRRTYQYDQERKKAMAETALKSTEGMPVHKDYGNGYKWIELKTPEIEGDIPPTHELEQYESKVHGTGYRVRNKQTGMAGEGFKTPERATQEFLKSNAEDRLQEALKYEGDTMGHCVGGYCPDVVSGKKRIFSLRDEKNEPHVTIEVRPQTANLSPGAWLNTLSPEQQIQIDESGTKPGDMPDYHEWVKSHPPAIEQIKGKGNAKPKKDYIPFVQDFVKSGKWSDVGDIQNAEMHYSGNLYTNNERKVLEQLTGENLEYVAHQDIPKHRALLKQHNVPPLLPDEKADGGEVDAEAIFMAKGGKVKEPKNTVKAYKLFRADEKQPGKLFPLFVNANKPVEVNKWVKAEVGEQNEKGKVKSKIGALAYRPGWHAGDLPIATHIGSKSKKGLKKPDTRPKNHVWAEVEMPDDVDWQTKANERGINKKGKLIPKHAHITDQVPEGGHYRYKTNPNMTGNWLIGGAMKVNKVLTHKEVERINKKAGVSDLPRREPFDKKDFGLKQGGSVDPESYFFPE